MRRKARRERYSARITAVWVAIMITCLVEIYFYTWCGVQCMRLKGEIGQQEETAAAIE